jgi:AraC family transcriptional regulator
MKPDVASRYHARMQRVQTYFDEHLDDDLDVDLLSGIAAFSKYHFHRQFASLFGISIYRYVQLLRLKRASSRLAFAGDPVLEVALDSGYGGLCMGLFSRFLYPGLPSTDSTLTQSRAKVHLAPVAPAIRPITTAQAHAPDCTPEGSRHRPARTCKGR